MTTGVLLTEVDRWIYSTLKADTTIAQALGGTADPRIYLHPAPQGSSYPVITFQDQAAPVGMSVGSIRFWDRPLYLVRAIDQVDGRQATLKTLANRILDVLHRAGGTTAGGATIVSCLLQEEFSLTEVPGEQGGRRYQHLGGIFRIDAQN